MNDTNGKEQRIREVAFRLWEQDGRPDDQADRHWEMARLIIEKEDAERREIEGEPPGDSAEGGNASDASTESKRKGR
jgi:hypothetical protein